MKNMHERKNAAKKRSRTLQKKPRKKAVNKRGHVTIQSKGKGGIDYEWRKEMEKREGFPAENVPRRVDQ